MPNWELSRIIKQSHKMNSRKFISRILHTPTSVRAEDGLFARLSDTMPPPYSQPKGGEGVKADRELILEDAGSICEGLWCMARYVQDAAEALDSRIEDETLDGQARILVPVASFADRARACLSSGFE